jgi:crossover junction endodeoxyribonuclease RusA
MTRISLVVYGSPAPAGSKRFVGTSKAGRGIMVESSSKVKPWRQDVRAEALKVRAGAPPLDGPLAVRMVFTVPKPASAPKRRRTFPMRKPDVSKLVRSTEDALVEAGLIVDDARIVEYLRAAKVFPNEDPEALEAPGARIEITSLDTIAELNAHRSPADMFDGRAA